MGAYSIADHSFYEYMYLSFTDRYNYFFLKIYILLYRLSSLIIAFIFLIAVMNKFGSSFTFIWKAI